MSQALHWIGVDNGKFTVNEEAQKYIGSLEGPVAVLTVVGLYRTGKSYLLNRITGNKSGFEVSPTVNSCTKGLWIMKPVIKLPGSDTQILVVDTEGLGSVDANENHFP